MMDNGSMDVTDDERRRLSEILTELESLDPADVPEAAARLAELLERLLEPGDV